VHAEWILRFQTTKAKWRKKICTFVRLLSLRASWMCIKQLVRNKSLNFGSTIFDQGCSKNRQKLLIFFPTSYIAPAVARTQKNDSPQNLTAGREKCCGRFLSHKSRRWIIHRVQNKTCSHNYNLFSKKRRDINFEYRRFCSFLSLLFSYTASSAFTVFVCVRASARVPFLRNVQCRKITHRQQQLIPMALVMARHIIPPVSSFIIFLHEDWLFTGGQPPFILIWGSIARIYQSIFD
jgi:hypothetical protein